MLLVVRHLNGAAPVRLVDGVADGISHRVRIQEDLAPDVPRRAADRLNERGTGAEEPLLVRVQDRDERYLGEVQPFAQEVDPHEHVELSEPQIAQDLHPIQRVDLGVKVAGADPQIDQVFRQILRHPLGQGRHQHALPPSDHLADLAHQMIDLAVHRMDRHLGIDQPGRPDDLFDHALAVPLFVRSGRGGGKDHLVQAILELGEGERPVVQRRGEPEAVFDQRLLPRPVPMIHPPDLRDRLVRLVDDQQEVLGEVIDENRRRLAGLPPVEMARVVLDPGAVAHLLHHLQVIARALLQSLRLQQPLFTPQPL